MVISISINEIGSISDYYLLIEHSYRRQNGDTATLTSPDFRLASPACLKFNAYIYSYMKGGMDTLEIVIIEGSKRNKIFNKRGDQGKRWLSYNVNLPQGGPYKVLIYHYNKLNTEVGYQIMMSFICIMRPH